MSSQSKVNLFAPLCCGIPITIRKKSWLALLLIYGENLHKQSLSHMKKTQFSVIVLLGYGENINYSAQTFPHRYPSPTSKFSAAHRSVNWTYAQMKYNQIPMQSPLLPAVCNCKYVTDHHHHHHHHRHLLISIYYVSIFC
jgi:hypothetical protein